MQTFSPYQNFIAISKYARWCEDIQRRETWEETVHRYLSFLQKHLDTFSPTTLQERTFPNIFSHLERSIIDVEVLPSMRALMTAGPALERSNIAGYNCAYLPIDDLRAFDETLYILMNGTGVGFSVEKKYVDQLPRVRRMQADWRNGGNHLPIIVQDSKEGWAEALRILLTALWGGFYPKWDMSLVRPAGSRLETFGGRSSGPEPLNELFEFVTRIFELAQGRKLTTLEVFDIICKIASVIVVGGVRRAALIGLTDLDDEELATAKSGEWWVENPQRALCNISAVYEEKPTEERFQEEWAILKASGSGERGIFNREAAQTQASRYGKRNPYIEYGVNPCSEIILRPYQFCNLSTVIVRPDDSLEVLKTKIAHAVVLGTFQSTLTDFPYLRDMWRRNTEEERLLGVSLTGQLAHPVLNGSKGFFLLETWLDTLRKHAVEVNTLWADSLGISRSAAITCVKPEGTTSQLSNSASGMHPWHSQYYTRRVRGDKHDPLTMFMQDHGFLWEDDVMNPAVVVFSFPVEAPEGALLRKNLSAIQHLKLWLSYQRHYTEHKPSITVSVREDEWEEVGKWVYEYFDELSGVAFLPYSDHTYKQAPYEELTLEEYCALAKRMPENVPWDQLTLYELYDTTEGVQTLACTANGCDI